MQKLPSNISSFLSNNRVATISFNDHKNHPYCFNCFYVFDPLHRVFIFKSSHGTFHEEFIKKTSPVAGTVLPDHLNVLKMQGLQFTGCSLLPAEIQGLELERIYHKAIPMAVAIRGYIWAVRPDHMKFTDSSLGFGKKTIWSPLQMEEAL